MLQPLDARALRKLGLGEQEVPLRLAALEQPALALAATAGAGAGGNGGVPSKKQRKLEVGVALH